MNDPFSKAQPTRDADASSFERDPEPFENENAIGGVSILPFAPSCGPCPLYYIYSSLISDTRKGTERRERAMAVLKARVIV